MERDSMVMTVFFESPFWVCILERIRDGKLSVAKVTFGAEPRDREVRDFLLDHLVRTEVLSRCRDCR